MNIEVLKIVSDNLKMGHVLSFAEVMLIQQAIDVATRGAQHAHLTANELSAILNWMTPPYTVSDTHTDEFNELRNKVFYALRDAHNDEPVSNRDELPVVVLHTGQAMSVFEALKKELLSEHVRNAELGVMGAVNVQVWTSIIGGIFLQYETSNGGCILRVMPAAPQEGMRNCIEEKKVAFREEMEMGSRLTKQRFRVK